MKQRPTQQQIEKLPKWAQDHIADTERERSEAVRTLNEFHDSQSKSGVWVESFICIGEKAGPSTKCHYIQSDIVRFKPIHSPDYFEVSLLDDGIKLICGHGSIVVLPECSNVVTITSQKS